MYWNGIENSSLYSLFIPLSLCLSRFLFSRTDCRLIQLSLSLSHFTGLISLLFCLVTVSFSLSVSILRVIYFLAMPMNCHVFFHFHFLPYDRLDFSLLQLDFKFHFILLMFVASNTSIMECCNAQSHIPLSLENV